MVDDSATQKVRPGDTVFIPKGAFHSTINTSYEPMVILAIYAPAGAEDVLKTLPDFQEVAGGEAPPLARG
jgi:oxalate decarboxylase/phosphoglucose isomerase-like protein (cupin superfamily)